MQFSLAKVPRKCFKVHQSIGMDNVPEKCLIIIIMILFDSYTNKLLFIWLFKECEKANSETKDN